MTAILRLDLPADEDRPTRARSFVSVVARSAGVPEEVVEDLRIAAADLARAAPTGPVAVRAEVQEQSLTIVLPLGSDGVGRVGMLAGLGFDVDADPEEGMIRLTVPVEA